MNRDDPYHRSRRRLLLSIVVLGLVWAILASLLGPRVVETIESASRGESLPLLNGLIERVSRRSLDRYLRAFATVGGAGLVVWVVALFVMWIVTAPRFFRRFVGTATPGTLGAIRMLVCVVLFVMTLTEDLRITARLPREMAKQIGVLKLFYVLPGIEKFLVSEESLVVFQGVTALLLFLGAIGWRTRLVVPLATLCYLLLGGILRHYGFFFHTGLVPLYVLIVLSFTPCGDGWSVDSLVRTWRGKPPTVRAAVVYGWARYACWVAVALPYVAAGLSKLRNGGWWWWTSTNMRSILYTSTLQPLNFDWRLTLSLSWVPDGFFSVMGLVSVIGEIAFILVLFSAVARIVLPSLMLMMHAGIIFLQNILFLDLILMQLIFFDFGKIRHAVGRRLAAGGGRVGVLFDGTCPLCRRTVLVLDRCDILDQLDLVDFRRLDLAEYNRRHNLRLAMGDLERDMHVVVRGKVFRGFDAYRVIALRLPASWPLAPLMYAPGSSLLGRRLYRYVARNRRVGIVCESACERHVGAASVAGEAVGDDPRVAVTAAPHGLRHAAAIALLVCTLLTCWVLRIEFYPLTAMQMFSPSDHSGVIYYYKYLVHYESGEVARVRLKDVLGTEADFRYRYRISQGFNPEREHVTAKYFAVGGRAMNRQARPGRRVTKFEVQKWKWDFVSDPHNPEYGRIEDRRFFDILTNDYVSRTSG